jgi:uncharacterized protein with ParB-like and HNH nuclease domain
MSYQSISVKEAINNINGQVNGWFLPAIQRPYVWGSRYENEMYICKLFDSILRGYPIGALIIWNTSEKIPYREFISNYHQLSDGAKIVEKGMFGRQDKWLVYDGQQRLQTLFSCLRYTFNDKILVYNLLFESAIDNEPDETGFSFVEMNANLPWHFLRLNELFSKQSSQDTKFEDEVLDSANEIELSQKHTVKASLRRLWKVFVETEKKSLAYFPISTNDEREVNEIFERLNSGGIPLSQSDLLFSYIKEEFPYFEENLQNGSKAIFNRTGKGYAFTAYNILQLIHLLVKGQVRVDPKKIKQSERKLFNDTWDKLEKPLEVFFTDFIWGQFRINNSSIVPRKISILPIIVYFYELYEKGFDFKNDIEKTNLQKIIEYFIKSQVNDWSLQSYIDNFASIIKSESLKAGTDIFTFPLDRIEQKISEQRKRQTQVFEESFIDYTWFALKVLMPQRVYQFEPDIQGRFNPEIDHIFPRKLKGMSKEYEKKVDIIWNMQPMKGDVNGFKSNHHPKLFFTDKANNSKGEIIHGSKYVNEYDYLPSKRQNNLIDFDDPIWDEHYDFIAQRRALMITFLRDIHGITLVPKQALTNP